MKLKPYPEYKDSSLPWIGEVPEHWEMRRFKYLLREVNSRSTDGSEQLLSVSQYTGVTPRQSRNGDNVPDTRAESLVSYKQVTPNDLVVNIMLAWNGSLGVSQSAGIVSPAYYVYRFNEYAHPWYFHNLLRTLIYKWRIKTESTGVVESRLRLYSDDLFRIEALLPSFGEQKQIANFLDANTRLIDCFIRNKERLIELLQGQKQAIINRAVTCGIDPDVHLKPSGINWLGDIPEHWEVLPIKRIFSSMLYGTSESSGDEGNYRVLTMGHLQEGEVLVDNCGKLKSVPQELILGKYDLLFNRTNSKELVGKVGLFEGDADDNVTFASYLVRMRVNQKVFPHYANYLLNSVDFLSFARQHAIPSLHQSNLNPTRYGRLQVALPARDEQESILRYIRKRTSDIDDAITHTRRQIDLIREYRTRLIADAVTGKVDVRGIPVEDVPEDEVWGEFVESREIEEALDIGKIQDAKQ